MPVNQQQALQVFFYFPFRTSLCVFVLLDCFVFLGFTCLIRIISSLIIIIYCLFSFPEARTTLEQALSTEAKLPKCPPRVKPEDIKSKDCNSSTYGCCPNGKDSATGPFGAGCTNPKTCTETKFGCCDDGVTPAQGKLKIRGCPLPDCEKSLFGCCPDGKSPAEGNGFLNCEKPCSETEYTSLIFLLLVY
jgi:hypothetical protein